MPQCILSWNGIKISNIKFSFLSEPRLSCTYVSVWKIKYWRAYILAFFALTANVAKIKKPPKNKCFTVLNFAINGGQFIPYKSLISLTENANRKHKITESY